MDQDVAGHHVRQRRRDTGTQLTAQRFGVLLSVCADYFVGENRDLSGGARICDNEWHHVAVTFDGQLVRTYVDGVGSVLGRFTLSTTGSRISLGRSLFSNNTHYETFRGELDDARIYSRVLERWELLALYHEGGWMPPWWPD